MNTLFSNSKFEARNSKRMDKNGQKVRVGMLVQLLNPNPMTISHTFRFKYSDFEFAEQLKGGDLDATG
ncbi:MAG: hypothetical protein ABIL69_10850 [candidate division WOR-3 bacterium]